MKTIWIKMFILLLKMCVPKNRGRGDKEDSVLEREKSSQKLMVKHHENSRKYKASPFLQESSVLQPVSSYCWCRSDRGRWTWNTSHRHSFSVNQPTNGFSSSVVTDECLRVSSQIMISLFYYLNIVFFKQLSWCYQT